MTVERDIRSKLELPTPLPIVRSWINILPSNPEPFQQDFAHEFIISKFRIAESGEGSPILDNPFLSLDLVSECRREGVPLAIYTQTKFGFTPREDLRVVVSDHTCYAVESLVVVPE